MVTMAAMCNEAIVGSVGDSRVLGGMTWEEG